MDLRTLVPRLLERQGRRIITFEKGRVVKRDYLTVYEDVEKVSARLIEWGVKPRMRVGIRASNCYEWVIHDLALLRLRAVSVAFTDDFARWSAADLCEKYSLSLLLVTAKDDTVGRPKPDFVAYLDAENDGVKAIDRGEPPADDDFDRIGLIFSSGSSGGVKGLILNRRGIEESVDAFTNAVVPRSDDCILLFLPISNFQQRLIYYAAFWYGFDIIVTEPSRLFHALKDLRPTILIAPPVLYETFETRFYGLPKWKRVSAELIADIALKTPFRAVREKIARALFSQAYETLGGRMRFMVTGMAPIKRSTLKFFRRMQLPLFETYVLIECGSVALNLPLAHKLGSVGRLLPRGQVELAEDGEIIVQKEHTVSVGYFECADGEADKTFIGNNRIATGDIGWLDRDGYLYLTGRKKEIIVTSGGEKVHLDLSAYQSAARRGNATDAIRVAVSRGINHKILFGADWPVSRMQDDQQSFVEAVTTEDGPLSELSDVDKANILYKNAERLLGMSR
jgi:long-subunit acyl-CoA synthetase (AMP-forming)